MNKKTTPKLDEARDRLSYALECMGECINALAGGRDYDPEQSQEALRIDLSERLKCAYEKLEIVRKMSK